MTQNPILLIARAIRLWLGSAIQFVRDLGEEQLETGNEIFSAFRKVVVKSDENQPVQPGAIFQVRFRFKNLSATANRRLSLIPIPLIIAQPGFRSKTWLLGQETGEFIGRYEFDTVEHAEEYWNSLPLRMMRKRAAPGTLTKKITAASIPNTSNSNTETSQ